MRRKLLPLIAVSFVLLGVQASLALTLSEIETEIRRNVRDTGSSLRQYSDTVLDSLINEAQRDIVNRSWCLETSTTITLTRGTTYYSLPNDLIALKQVWFQALNNGTITELGEVAEKSFRQQNPDYERTYRGPPTQYFVRTSTSGANPLEIAFIPIPTTGSTGTVTAVYYHQPTDLSSDSDVPFEGLRALYPYHWTLVYHVASQIFMLRGETAAATTYRALYEQLITLMIDRLGRMPNYNPGFQGGGGGR